MAHYKSLKICLALNNKQITLAKKHARVARHAYNWGLDTCIKAFQLKKKRPSAIDLHKKLVHEVKSVHTWYYEVSKCSPQQDLRDFSESFQNSIKKASKRVFIWKVRLELKIIVSKCLFWVG